MVDTLALDDPIRPDSASRHRSVMAQAARLILPAIAGVSPVQQLLNVPALWSALHEGHPARPAACARLQSPRRRGVAPACPHGADGADGAGRSEGMLAIYPAGFVLEPSDPRHPCINIACSTIGAATFYRDAFDVTLSSGGRFVVHTGAVEQVDSIFQAYFWNAMT